MRDNENATAFTVTGKKTLPKNGNGLQGDALPFFPSVKKDMLQ